MTNVHKDFHGCLSFGLKFLAENYGSVEVEEYLRRVARTVYAPLIQRLRSQGLPALAVHWRRIMTLEDADFRLYADDDVLILEIRECPAIHHMKAHSYEIAPNFCESTRIVNDEISRRAGFSTSTEYDQAIARCTQRFWRHE